MGKARPQALRLAQLAAIIDGSVDAIVATDSEGFIETWNPAASRMFGYTAEEIVGRPVSILVPEDRQAELSTLHAQIRAGESVGRLETERIAKNGRRFPVSVTYSPIRDHRGQLVGISAIKRDITDRLRMEASLRASETRFRLLFENSLDALLLADDQGCYQLVNQAACELLGYSKEQLLRMSVADLPVADDGFPSGWHFERCRSQRQQRGRFRMVRPDGETRVLEFAAVQIAPGQHLSDLRDVTEAERHEMALRRSEQQLRAVLDSLPIGVWFTDSEGLIVYGNPAGVRVWGGAAFVGPADYSAYQGWWADTGRRIQPEEWALARALHGESSLNERIEIEGFDGVRRSVLNSALPLRAEDGSVRGALVLIEDVTPRERAEAAMRTSQRRLAAVVNHAAEGIVTIDSDGRIEAFNPAAERIFGYRAEEVIGHDISTLMPWPYRRAHPREPARDCDAREQRILGITRELRGIRKDGSVFPMELSVSEIEHLGSFTGIIRDITERKDLEARLREADRMATIGNFAAGLSHDMSNIVSPVLLRVGLLEDLGLEGEAAASVHALRRCADSLANLTAAMRRLVQRDAGTEIKSLDLPRWWAHMRPLLQLALPMGVTLDGRIAAGLPPLAVSEGELTRVVLNLVVNAGEAIAGGGAEQGRVSVCADHGDSPQEVRIVVRDDGPGIPPGIRDQIFERFFSTKSGLATGLGLPMVAAFATEVGGSVEVESELGCGTEIVLRLPGVV